MSTNPDVLGKWIEKWENNNIRWHKTSYNESLMKYSDILIDGRSSVQIFFPMCGKCIDMKWFYDKGHKVVGVEYCEKAIKDFFKEQGLQYEIETVEKIKGKLFKTSDGNIKLFCCDIYHFDKECAGLMDAVWDRGALGAVEKEDRKRFVSLMLSLLAPGYRYLLSVFVYDDWFYSGCPRTVPDKLVHKLYDQNCCSKQLERISRQNYPAYFTAQLDTDFVEEVIWLFTKK